MNPTTMPPMVISSGMIKCSKSINVAAINPARTRQCSKATHGDARPKLSQQPRKTIPVSNSTRKYRTEIGAPQLAHFPRSHSQVTSGTFKYQGIEYLQWGQCEGGETTLSPRGNL